MRHVHKERFEFKRGIQKEVHVRPPLKNLFPVQRVAEIVASQAAAKSFFSPSFIFLVTKIKKIVEKNSRYKTGSHSAIYPPGRSTGTNIFLRMALACTFQLTCSSILKGELSPLAFVPSTMTINQKTCDRTDHINILQVSNGIFIGYPRLE